MISDSEGCPALTSDGHSLLERLPSTAEGFPRVLSITDELPHTRIQLDVASELCWFRGHFPGQAVLPGIVQLHWATLVCRSIYGFGVPREVKRLKFKKLVIPPTTLELVISQQGEREALFSFSSLGGDVHSEGKILFSEA